ncbi:restriction endonuclease [Sporosarcina sp. G11-34]|uniref:restriction endonuclease n=1 Tax=Sporosarcina sp. G11-34 TaxID=2849605 RepID=UPI0022A8D823|nr:restriction endonuclease [Sporosarcina sp. G11-34]
MGWYTLGTLKGVGIAVGIGLGIIIIFSLLRAMRFKERMRQSGIADVDQMTGRQFEEYVGTLFEGNGYRVTYTPATGDFGADLILKKGREVVVVQAKRYKNSVGVAAVQEVIPAMKMYHANAAWVVSNSYYTKAAVTLAKSNHVKMIDRNELIRISINLKNNANESMSSVETSEEPIRKPVIKSSDFHEEILVAATLQVDSMSNTSNKLETILKEFRLKKSRQSGMKAFHIFTNKTLDELVEKRPITIEELRKVKGIGEKKIEGFGEELVWIIRSLKV